jgi:hypothetical protein
VHAAPSEALLLQDADYEDLAALAGRLAAQQEEVQRLSAALNTANSKRAELAKVCLCSLGCRGVLLA